MTKTILKLRSKRGETLAEILVSIVLLGLSISILSAMLITAYNLNKAAKEADDTYYSELSAAEGQGEADRIGKGTVIIKEKDSLNAVEVEIDLFGVEDENGLRSYAAGSGS